MDAIGYGIFFFFKRKPRAIPENIRTILVIRLDHVGDVLLSTAVPKAIKENYSHSRVIFLVSSWSAPLLENNPFIDEIITYDAPWFAKKRYKKNADVHGFFGLVRVLRGKEIELAIALRGDLRENILMFLSGIKNRVGYGVTGGGFLLTKEVPYQKGVHESAHQGDMLSALGMHHAFLESKLYFSETETLKIDQRLDRLGIQKNDKFICLLVGAGSRAKEWPIENVNLFLDELANKFSAYKVLIVGASLRLSEQLRNMNNRRFLNLIGETSLRELCLMIRRASLFVGPDSGPTHIAAVLGIPSIFLYSGTNDFERWKPLNENALVLRHPVPCSPCQLDACPIQGHPCMAGILPQEVLKSLESRL